MSLQYECVVDFITVSTHRRWCSGLDSTLSRLSSRHLFLVGGVHSNEANLFDVEKNEWNTVVEEADIPESVVRDECLTMHQAVEIETEKGVVVICIGGKAKPGCSPNIIVFDVTF